MRIHKKIIPLIIMILICYMYIVTVASYFNINIDIISVSSSRAQLLTIIVAVGVMLIARSHYLKLNPFIKSASLLATYMFIIGLGSYGQFLQWLSTSVLWVFILVITYNFNFDQEDGIFINNLFLSTCILLSVIYLYGQFGKITIHTVASTNSIYYVLGAIPFVFLNKSKLLRNISFIISSVSIVASGKSTCLLALLCIWLAFLLAELQDNEFKPYSIIVRVLGVLVMLFVVWNFAKQYIASRNLGITFQNIIDELLSGGNGRAEIYSLTLDAFKESEIIGQIFGHGFNAINNRINIGTHNDFLMVLYNYGIAGLLLYLVMWFQLIKSYFQYMKNNNEKRLAFLSSLIVFFWISIASNVLNTQIQFLLLCVFWGYTMVGIGKEVDVK